jgi:TM2 domain-containing membrane protein YozV
VQLHKESPPAPPPYSGLTPPPQSPYPASPPPPGYGAPPVPPTGYGAPPYPPPPAGYGPGYAPPYVYGAAKSRTSALLLEILPGLFGILGIGWLYIGQTSTGLIWLIGYLVWNFVAMLLDLVTFGLFLCIHLPVNIACLVVSPIMLNNYMQSRPGEFSS